MIISLFASLKLASLINLRLLRELRKSMFWSHTMDYTPSAYRIIFLPLFFFFSVPNYKSDYCYEI